jgi:hypothetical protein
MVKLDTNGTFTIRLTDAFPILTMLPWTEDRACKVPIAKEESWLR